MSSNLPPGLNESDIPGNRPEDQEQEKLWNELHDWIDDFCEENGIDVYEAKRIIEQRLIKYTLPQ